MFSIYTVSILFYISFLLEISLLSFKDPSIRETVQRPIPFIFSFIKGH